MTTNLQFPSELPEDYTGQYVTKDGNTIHYEDGLIHCTTGPAIYYKNGTQEYWVCGEKQSDEAFHETFLLRTTKAKYEHETVPYLYTGIFCHLDGTKIWYKEGIIHRQFGPAIEWCSGTKEWRLRGLKTRTNGPALEFINGDKEWWRNGELHREDGPAIQYSNGYEEWHVLGVCYMKDDFLKLKAEDKKETILELKTYHDEVPINYTGKAIDYLRNVGWYLNGKLHRVGAPAKLWVNGDRDWYFCGMLHREDGPAMDHTYSTKWYLYGQLHREDGPAIENKSYYNVSEFWLHGAKVTEKVQKAYCQQQKDVTILEVTSFEEIPEKFTGKVKYSDGTIIWYQNGLIHRDFGPAIELSDGTKKWFLFGKKHRKGAPAVITFTGKKEWYFNDQLHRTDGPAIEDSKEILWYVFGIPYTKKEIDFYQRHQAVPRMIYDLPYYHYRFSGTINLAGRNILYFLHGMLHREDGPAVKLLDFEISEWYQNGVRHREDGPAVENTKFNSVEYWLHGQHLTEEQFKEIKPQDTYARKASLAKLRKIEQIIPSITLEKGINLPSNFTGKVVIPLISEKDGHFHQMIHFYRNGYLHREEGPAIIDYKGDNHYFYFGRKVSYELLKLLTVNKVVIQYPSEVGFDFDGIAFVKWEDKTLFYRKGRLHREDGPAMISHRDNRCTWFLNGNNLSEKEFNEHKMIERRSEVEACDKLATAIIKKCEEENSDHLWLKELELCWDQQNYNYFLKITTKNKPHVIKIPNTYQGIKILHIEEKSNPASLQVLNE